MNSKRIEGSVSDVFVLSCTKGPGTKSDFTEVQKFIWNLLHACINPFKCICSLLLQAKFTVVNWLLIWLYSKIFTMLFFLTTSVVLSDQSWGPLVLCHAVWCISLFTWICGSMKVTGHNRNLFPTPLQFEKKKPTLDVLGQIKHNWKRTGVFHCLRIEVQPSHGDTFVAERQSVCRQYTQ